MSLSSNRYLDSYQLELVQNTDPIKGRSVITKKSINRGSVLTTSQPLGTVILKPTEVCNYCCRVPVPTQSNTSPLQRCSRCKSAFFCDVGCFKNAWLSYHQFVCQPSAHSKSLAEETEQHLDQEMLERVTLNVWRDKKRKTAMKTATSTDDSCITPNNMPLEETVDVTMEAFSSLMDHYERQPKHLLEQYTIIAKKALSQPYISDTGMTVPELVRFLCRFKCNNFGIHDDQLSIVGEGTYPIGSLLNHSCRPNAVVMFDGALMIIRAIEDIPAGQEVTIAYVDAAHSRIYRQKALQEKYMFQCSCLRCDDTTIYGQIDTLLGEEESDWDRAQSLCDPSSGLGPRLLQDIEDWDLLQMCQQFDRKHDGKPNIHQPLTVSTYTHYLIQYFAPYLWTTNNASIFQPASPGKRIEHLVTFDDPRPEAALPAVCDTYDDILRECIQNIRQYPLGGMVPFRLTTLTTATRLFYDEMADSHWQNAVKLGMYILVQYCLLYPPYHPILAQHLLLLAKACWNSIIQLELLEDGCGLEKVYERGVRRWILLSKESIQCCFGKQGDQWREVLELEWLFLREQKLK
ncbi:uncharacterized protein BYT42DRAFT_600671 [Radiomyces spectabilis]|uniref:uncharacterized protein n=1 Tax=Radiomyces spectabilis TaxID=64574 RepID=UPI00221E73AA|nr:uncharacterized protein BYT42DRAFT_600671 [Radiomyces spectabilis]KAI8365904.1 hypothetical protein BYT42DRAFT_600671 [Radiomyces spectabilis]